MEGSLAEAVGAIASRPTILVADRGGPTMIARIGVMRGADLHTFECAVCHHALTKSA